MDPVCFTIGSRPVYWYGVMVAVAFMAGIVNWIILGRKEGRDSSFACDLGFWIMLSGIVGARITYVIADISYFIENPWEIIRLDHGGLIFYGGFVAAFLAVIIFARVKHEKLLPFCDFVTTALPLGHAIGRIGCFLNGCCYGTLCNLTWSVCNTNTNIEGARHPTQLYSFLLNLVVYVILLLYYPHRKRAGRVMALYLMLYPLGRFLLEFVRGDDRIRLYGFSVAQYASLFLFAAGLALWFSLPRQAPAKASRK